ncbi:hypothetical protein [Cerasicoccus maritimus]|uniref:hypothetical protein n=1 Tax=Cerasicoccus maritimus TaxID=490089 RepID=UPI0028527A4B|nr:hypothetical protein [Cerasicoccus maritimus]
MPRGESGRIVLEVNPEEKRDLYDALGQDGLTLKDWFLGQARRYLRDRNQRELFFEAAEASRPFSAGKNAESTKQT